ncbi:hypothetical protein ACQ4M3_41765 [Leptolyngbya sp. AN03gr2]|uniref:hypothetical protein n=1 Tax=unclassified Leptolyngbya TaxID=2650499 RepID=UPI003D31AD76
MAKRKSISTKVWRPLLAQSGNRCAFPGCKHPIIDEKHNLVAQLCHIEAVSPEGQRYNSKQTDEERNGYDNLLFLCHRHHVETDNIDEYPVQRLKDIKYQHESQFAENPFEVDLSIAYLLKKEMEAYWNEVEDVHSNHPVFDELKISVDSKALFKQLFTDARELLCGIDEMCGLMNANDRERGEVYNWELYTYGSLIFREGRQIADLSGYKSPSGSSSTVEFVAVRDSES